MRAASTFFRPLCATLALASVISCGATPSTGGDSDAGGSAGLGGMGGQAESGGTPSQGGSVNAGGAVDAGSKDGAGITMALEDAAPQEATSIVDTSTVDASTSCGNDDCGPDEVCVHPGCGGGVPICEPASDSGTCPPGWRYGLCVRSAPSSQPGCAPPPCTPPPAYCIHRPAACSGASVTCLCLPSNVCNGPDGGSPYGGQCGFVSQGGVSCGFQ
jgi:hypothetical protein